MKYKTFSTFVFLITLALSMGMVRANAESITSPLELLETTSNKVIEIFKKDKAVLKDDARRVQGIINEHILPHLDQVTMAKLALGKNWRKANNEERIKFVEEFRVLLVRTYSKSLQEFTDQTIKFFPLNMDDQPTKVTVKSEVLQSGGPSIPVYYRMRLKNNAWKVYDIKIDGVSLVTSYRGTFAQEIRKGGMTGLLKLLRDKNSKVRAANKPS